VLAALRFLWNATRRHRFTPWRSDYLKWRIETYSGKKAETIEAADFWRFLWRERAELLRFFAWTGDFAAQSRRGSRTVWGGRFSAGRDAWSGGETPAAALKRESDG
jgi:hypothetical protein